MDAVRARRIADELLGQEVGSWTVRKLIDNGKSAVVLEAESGGQVAALKLFDPELIERFGEAAQAGRIDRELALLGKRHENLVSILDGGKCDDTGYFYIAMELIPAPNLARQIERLPRSEIRPIIAQVAQAAEFLDTLKIAHRDIKPENIAYDAASKRAVLLDLGVIRPIGANSLTDIDGLKPFIGTLRYASPEFLERTEQDTPDGWRALSFYQLGAVLHDLIMRSPLFKEFSEPFVRLVDAVRREKPRVDAEDVSGDLISLANDCLVKNPDLRLRFVDWDRFRAHPSANATPQLARERILKRKALSEPAVPFDLERRRRDIERRTADLKFQMRAIVQDASVGSEAIPPAAISANNTADTFNVNVLFPKGTATAQYVTRLLFTGTTLDADANVVIIRYSACLCANEHDVAAAPKEYILSGGVFDPAMLRSRIVDILFVTVDQAQETAAAPGLSVPYWLPAAPGYDKEFTGG